MLLQQFGELLRIGRPLSVVAGSPHADMVADEYLFIVFIIVFFGFATFVVHYGKIIIDSENKKIVFYVFFWFKPQRYSFSFAEIKELILDEKIEEINVITLITTDKIIKFTGYKSLKGIKENLEKSRQIVETINMQINIR